MSYFFSDGLPIFFFSFAHSRVFFFALILLFGSHGDLQEAAAAAAAPADPHPGTEHEVEGTGKQVY